MNYYPNNFYTNYPYVNGYSQYNSQAQLQNSLPSQPTQLNTIQGKIVDGEEMVKATEVPLGGYGIFPKADLNEIYVKTWNNNGNTLITVYRPVIAEQKEEVDINALLLEKINGIENKIDSIVSGQAKTPQKALPEKGKELNLNVY